MSSPNEEQFEAAICDSLRNAGGYVAVKNDSQQGDARDFDPVRGLDIAELFAFIGATQADAWDELIKRYGGDVHVAPAHMTGAVDVDEAKRIEQQFSVRGVERFLDAAAETRTALAALHSHNPDLRAYWDHFEVSEEDFDYVAVTLADRRCRPTKHHGTPRVQP